MIDEILELTQEGLDKIKTELHQLKTVNRKEVANRLEAAKELGDLSENADYQQAKDDSAWIEGRINQLNEIISRAVVAQAPKIGIVSIGSIVTVRSNEKQSVLSIVGSTEADPLIGKISSESPIGNALIGAKTGESVMVNTPAGNVEYEVIDIE